MRRLQQLRDMIFAEGLPHMGGTGGLDHIKALKLINNIQLTL